MVGPPDRDERLMSLVESALSLSAAERDLYLRIACEDDPELYREVTERITWEERMNGFLLDPLIPRAEPESSFKPGDKPMDRFEIVRKIAEGGMAVVYEAMDHTLGERIAIKTPKPGFRRRLPPELKAALKIAHRNVCRMHEIHTVRAAAGEVEFLTMELVEGETLHARMRRRGRLPATEARQIALQICAGLAEAHRRGVIHGDLKPANILLTREHDGGMRAVITDFGLARPVAGITTSAGSGMQGTPSFAAPELWKGAAVSKASDLYALGVILYEMISGRRPFEGRSPGDEVPPPGKMAAGVPASWDTAIARCMAPEPRHRPASAEDVARMLDAPAWKMRWGVWAAAALVPILALLFVVFRPAPAPAILALLDLDADGASAVFGRGVMVDVSRRLSALPGADSRKLRVIPVDDAATNDVRRAAQAAAAFGATHVLTGSIRRTGDRFQVRAAIVDAKTNQKLKELHAGYELAEIAALPAALTSIAGAVFGLRSVSADTVSQPAYPDYVAGLSHMKADLDSLNQAIAAFERAVQLDPASAATHAALAEAEWRKWGQTKQSAWLARAEQSAGKAQARNPDSPQTLLIVGRLKAQRSAYPAAEIAYRRAAEISPGNPEAPLRLADLARQAGKPAEAAQLYEKAIALDPGYYKPYLDYSVFLSGQGRFDDAIQQTQIVTRMAPGLRTGHYELGRNYLASGRLDEAEKAFHTALAIRETWAELIGLGYVALLRGRFAESVSLHEKAMPIAPNLSNLWANLGDAYRLAGRASDAASAYRKALAAAETAIQINPTSAHEHAMVGYATARTGDTHRATVETNQALALAPADTRVMRRAAVTWEAIGRRDLTLSVLSNAPVPMLEDLRREPDLSDLVSDPRFIQLRTPQN